MGMLITHHKGYWPEAEDAAEVDEAAEAQRLAAEAAEAERIEAERVAAEQAEAERLAAEAEAEKAAEKPSPKGSKS